MRKSLVLGGALALLLLVAALAEARPGGGQSYSGSSSSRSSSSSSSGGRSSSSSSSRSGSSGAGGDSAGMFFVWVLAVFGGIFGVGFVGAMREASQKQSWSSARRSPAPLSTALQKLRAEDPDFSLVLFEDFAFALFARAHGARHSETALAALSPYLTGDARAQLLQRDPVAVPVKAAVVGAMRIVDVYEGIRELKVELVFEANLVVGASGGDRTHYVREKWLLGRPPGARTRRWKGVRTFGCPACGAPLRTAPSRLCASCGQPVNDGRFDWRVGDVEVEQLEERPPSLTGTVEEKGTDLATQRTPGTGELFEALLKDDPALTLEGLEARLRLIFDELQKAWARQDLSGVRPFVSAGLYQYLGYWVSAYRAQGLRNEVEGATLLRSELARVVRDVHYDALTLRIWGSGRDFTVRVDTGVVVSGSRTEDRTYTEYWTLVRGAQARGAPRTDLTCPACGAAIQVSMEGICAHCGALVTSGDFDWVLSRIEQDDAYTA